MTVTHVVVHTGYALMLGAIVARDVLWLRSLLVAAQSLIGLYAWLVGVPAIAAWNAIFVILNAAWVVQIARERRAVRLPPPLRLLHERYFAALTPPEFLRWWRQGERQSLDSAALTRRGTRPDFLYFLVAGAVRISRRGATVVDLPAGFFVGEMSLLTGEPANADADALGTIAVVRWPVADLAALREWSPVLWTKIQSVLGRDVVEKIRLEGH